MKLQSFRKTISEKREHGFTLVEILVVIGILAVLLAVSLVAINPTQHFIDSRNSQRWSNVNAILDAIYEYQATHNGSAPPSLSAVTTSASPLALVAVPTDEVDLCGDLAPNQIADLPMDPSADAPTGGATPCATATTAYDTGYTIKKSATGNRFTVSAPLAEDSVVISVTR
jgi:prepilin-type N-terminal cleavage/methylation domain-containing protein